MTETKLEDEFESVSDSVGDFVDKRPSWLAAVVAGFLVGALAILTSIFGATLILAPSDTEGGGGEDGPPSALEASDMEFSPSTIEMDLTNTSDEPVGVGQAFINDQFVNFEGVDEPIAAGGTTHLIIDYPWQEDREYEIVFLLSNGSAFAADIETEADGAEGSEGEAAEAEEPTPSEVWYLLGIAVIAAVSIVAFAVPALRKSGADPTRSVLGVSTGLIAATGVVAAIIALTHL